MWSSYSLLIQRRASPRVSRWPIQGEAFLVFSPEPGGILWVSFLSAGTFCRVTWSWVWWGPFLQPWTVNSKRHVDCWARNWGSWQGDHPRWGGAGRNPPGWGAKGASVLWGDERGHSPLREGHEDRCPRVWALVEALKADTESWGTRDQTLRHTSGYLEGLLLIVKV